VGKRSVRNPDWAGNRLERYEDTNLVGAGSLGRGKPTSLVL
jgi:hypothetical protein